MQKDFHYYAACCAAILAGYSPEESQRIGYSDQFTDCCTRSLLRKMRAPLSAVTTQVPSEMVNARTDILGLQDITRIWASFHFLPYDLGADLPGRPKGYRNKYRLICNPNGPLLAETVKLAKKAGNLQAAGLAMHVLSDTWAHRYFAGTPSLVINNTNEYFYEILPDGAERKVVFRHNPRLADDLENGCYLSSIYQENEHSVMNLGHGRAGHLPDYSFIRYRYLPSWGEYAEVVKDNPKDYYCAFAQMVYALRYLRGAEKEFRTDTYAFDLLRPWETEIRDILSRRQPNACADWKKFGEKLSGCEIPDFDAALFPEEYLSAPEKEKMNSGAGRFLLAAMAQKSMVTGRIFRSGNLLAGYSLDFGKKLRGIRDFYELLKIYQEGSRE
jgi:hypothetical protein